MLKILQYKTKAEYKQRVFTYFHVGSKGTKIIVSYKNLVH